MIGNLFRGLLGVWLLSSMSSVFALDVVLNVGGTVKASCAYSSVAFGQDGKMTVTCSGDVTCVGCGSTALTPQVIAFGSVPNVVVGGTGTVSATGGGSNNPVVFSSTTTNTCSVSGTNGSTVTGLAAGTCTIAANQAGNASYSAAPQVTQNITVSTSGNSACAGVPVPNIFDINIETNSGGGHMLVDASSAAAYATAAFRFTTSPGKYGIADFNFEEYVVASTSTATWYGKNVALSTCPGDFSGIGVTAGSIVSCYAENSSPLGGIFYEVGTSNPKRCKLEPGTQYYFNVKNSVPGVAMKFNLIAHPATSTSP